MNRINLDGEFISVNDFKISAQNRAFRYGDGFFEAIRMFNNQIPFFGYHLDRIKLGFNVLGFDNHPITEQDFLKLQIKRTCEESSDLRIRLSVWRHEGGWFAPYFNNIHYSIEEFRLADNRYPVFENGLNLITHPDLKLFPKPYSGVKMSSAIDNVLAAKYAFLRGKDDCILLDYKDKVVELSSSNIFILKNGTLYSPPLSSGCVKGTIRSWMFDNEDKLGMKVKSQELTLSDLKNCDLVFSTNAILGPRWVQSVDGKAIKFNKDVYVAVVKALNDYIGSYN